MGWILAILAGLWLFFIAFDRVLLPFVVRHGQDREVPNITRAPFDAAEKILTERQLGFAIVGREYHPDEPEGIVISQTPLPGAVVKKGRVVKVFISRGGETAVVPALVGLTLRQAQIALLDAGLDLGAIGDTTVDTLPVGQVVASQPPAGANLRLGIPVKLFVNQAAQVDSLVVPHLVGRSLAEARLVLGDLGLALGQIRYEKNDKLLPGTVTEQAPEAGTVVGVPAIVELTVSKTD